MKSPSKWLVHLPSLCFQHSATQSTGGCEDRMTNFIEVLHGPIVHHMSYRTISFSEPRHRKSSVLVKTSLSIFLTLSNVRHAILIILFPLDIIEHRLFLRHEVWCSWRVVRTVSVLSINIKMIRSLKFCGSLFVLFQVHLDLLENGQCCKSWKNLPFDSQLLLHQDPLSVLVRGILFRIFHLVLSISHWRLLDFVFITSCAWENWICVGPQTFAFAPLDRVVHDWWRIFQGLYIKIFFRMLCYCISSDVEHILGCSWIFLFLLDFRKSLKNIAQKWMAAFIDDVMNISQCQLRHSRIKRNWSINSKTISQWKITEKFVTGLDNS